MPCVRVWELGGAKVADVQSHNYGISHVAFSTNNQYIVSVGYQHDMTVSVWDWKVIIHASIQSYSILVFWYSLFVLFVCTCTCRKVWSSPPTKCPAEYLVSPSLRTAATLSQQETDMSSSGTWMLLKNRGYLISSLHIYFPLNY